MTGAVAGGEQCLTCGFDDEICAYVSASMSPDHQFYMLRCSGPDVPTDALYHINGTLGDNTYIRIAVLFCFVVLLCFWFFRGGGHWIHHFLYLPPVGFKSTRGSVHSQRSTSGNTLAVFLVEMSRSRKPACGLSQIMVLYSA